MQITVTNDDGSTADITEAVLMFLDETPWSRAADYLTASEVATAVAALRSIQHPDASHAITAMEAEQKRREEAAARQDAWARQREQRDADNRKAAAQLAKEMREKEPALVRGGWTDAELVTLHQMRNSGMA